MKINILNKNLESKRAKSEVHECYKINFHFVRVIVMHWLKKQTTFDTELDFCLSNRPSALKPYSLLNQNFIL